MQLEHSFTVPVGIDDAWKVLLDIERIAPCMPGGQLETVDGDEFTGTVKVKLGPISLTYKGKAGFVEKDEAAHRAVINAQGRDARGNGTASAKVTATLTDQSGETKVDVLTDLDVTGKPAQFGRGVMVDVGNKLIGQFADCVAGKLSGGGDAAAAPAKSAAAPEPKAATKTAAATKGTATKGTATKGTATKGTAAKSAPAKAAAPAKKTSPAKTTAKKAAPAAAEQVAEASVAAEPAAAPETDAATEAASSPETTQPEASQPEVTQPETSQPEAPEPEASQPGASEPESAQSEPAPSASRTVLPTAEVEPIDLLEHAGPAVAKRLAPVLAAIIALLIILRQRKR